MPNWSLTVTLSAAAWPAVALAGAVRLRLAAAAARTLLVSVPVMLAVAASVAVMVCAPALMSVAEKVPWPLVSVESAGSTTPAEVSLLVKWTVPV